MSMPNRSTIATSGTLDDTVAGGLTSRTGHHVDGGSPATPTVAQRIALASRAMISVRAGSIELDRQGWTRCLLSLCTVICRNTS